MGKSRRRTYVAFYFANFLDAHLHFAGLAFNCQLIKHSRNSLSHPVHSVLLLPVPTIWIGSIDPILNNPSGIAFACNVQCNDSALRSLYRTKLTYADAQALKHHPTSPYVSALRIIAFPALNSRSCVMADEELHRATDRASDNRLEPTANRPETQTNITWGTSARNFICCDAIANGAQ